MPERSAVYRISASDCLRLAAYATTPEAAERWRHIAEEWTVVADEIEAAEERERGSVAKRA
jgi:hypothetical protein